MRKLKLISESLFLDRASGKWWSGNRNLCFCLRACPVSAGDTVLLPGEFRGMKLVGGFLTCGKAP